MLLNILETSFNIDFDHGLGKRVLKFGFINLRISELLDLSKKKSYEDRRLSQKLFTGLCILL